VCDLETSRIGAPYIYDISSLRVNVLCDCSWNKKEEIAKIHSLESLKKTCISYKFNPKK